MEMENQQAILAVRRKMEKKLERQRCQIEIMLQHLPGGMVICHQESGHPAKWVSNSFCQMLGYNDWPDFYEGTRNYARGMIYAEDYPEVCEQQELQLNQGDTYTLEYRAVCKDGSLIWAADFGKKGQDADGEPVLYSFVTDITQRKKQEERIAKKNHEVELLRRAQEQEQFLDNHLLRAAVGAAYICMLKINLSQNIYRYILNDSKYYMHAVSGEYDMLIQELTALTIGSQKEKVCHLFDRQNVLQEFRSGKPEVYLEFQYKAKDEVYHWISILLVHVADPIQHDVLAVAMIKVLDEQRREQARQEKLLRDALASARAANQAKSDFLSRMSHDIRTPLNAIMGMSTIGQMQLEDAEHVHDCFEKIDMSSSYLLSLINNILDMAKIEAGKMVLDHSVFSLEELLQQITTIIEPQTQKKGIHFRVQRQKNLEKFFLGDVLRLKQVLMNLLSNAVKFTPESGEIVLDIAAVERRNGYAHLRFVLSDTGVGISEDFMHRLFHPFEQENKETSRNNIGSGLGLSIVYNLVRMMGGSISVKSRKRRGTSFTVLLPLEVQLDMDDGLDVREKRESWRQARLRGKRVLLVEDNEINMEIAKTLLEAGGLLVDTAADGLQALRKAAKAEPYRYYAILMDIRMPRLDGLEAARTIRKLPRDDAKTVPIIAMTANAFEEDRSLAYEAGMNGYLTKPVDPQLLFDELEKI